MLFNSLDFAIFLPIVFCLYWFVTDRSLRLQNILLLVASYFFYSCWDWRFLFLLMFSTLLDFLIGMQMDTTKDKKDKKKYLWISIAVNLGFLGIFKYYNFFAQSFAELVQQFGFQINPWTIQLILPVGISFYTFHGLSYVFDIYNEKIKPEKNFVDYAVFVSFFPLLVAGPIERATHLLPQIKSQRIFRYSMASDGLRQILWGLFKKMVIADNCSVFSNAIFDHASSSSSLVLISGAVFFAFQIYADFSGYSDIAIGTGKLFGIELFRNFAFPYFSRDIAEFWRRWHISLTSWFRDYLYIPLGGSRGNKWIVIRNVFIVFLVSGLWHGANWTFIIWGLLHAIYFIPLLLLNKNRNHLSTVASSSYLPSVPDFIAMVMTFGMSSFAWIFFRCRTLSEALNYISGIFSRNHFSFQLIPENTNTFEYGLMVLFLIAFIIVEWIQREKEHGLVLSEKYPIRNWVIYIGLATITLLFSGSQQEFIYFQF